MYRVFGAVCDSSQVLVCRLVGGKVTFVHRRLWPALVRLGSRLSKRGLAAVQDEHTAPRSICSSPLRPYSTSRRRLRNLICCCASVVAMGE
jgi:hypothetical protein